MAIVTTDDKHYLEIANRIRHHLGWFEDDEMYLPEEMPDKVDCVYEEGYWWGYDNGERDGYNNGYEAGYNEGDSQDKLDAAWDEGYNTGWDAGYESGYNDCEEFESEKWYQEGYQDAVESLEPAIETAREEGKQAVYSEVEGINTQLLNIVSGTDTGGKSYYDAFWDEYQDNGNRRAWAYAFYNLGWNDAVYNPKYDICGDNNNCYMIFGHSHITDTKVVIDVSKATLSDGLFTGCRYLKTIRLLRISENQNTQAYFNYCQALENITIEGAIGKDINLQWSTKLTKASITSVVNALSTTTSGLPATFSKTAVETAFGSTESAEWLQLINTKKNWTISLV